MEWSTALIRYFREHDYQRFEPQPEAEDEWVEHVKTFYEGGMIENVKSWFTGYNSNVEGHEEGTIRYLVYNGGMPKYVTIINDVAASDYDGVVFDRAPASAAEAAG